MGTRATPAYADLVTAARSAATDTIVVLALTSDQKDETLDALGNMPGVEVLAIVPQEAPARRN